MLVGGFDFSVSRETREATNEAYSARANIPVKTNLRDELRVRQIDPVADMS